MDIESIISPHVWELEEYAPPDWSVLASRAGMSVEQLTRMYANENPYGPSPRARDALSRFDRYGQHPSYTALEKAVAGYAGVDPESIVLGNGGEYNRTVPVC